MRVLIQWGCTPGGEFGCASQTAGPLLKQNFHACMLQTALSIPSNPLAPSARPSSLVCFQLLRVGMQHFSEAPVTETCCSLSCSPGVMWQCWVLGGRRLICAGHMLLRAAQTALCGSVVLGRHRSGVGQQGDSQSLPRKILLSPRL